MPREKGITPLFIIIIVSLVLAAIGFVLVSQGIIKLPGSTNKTSPASANKPTVELKEEYKNPFDKKTNYTNPFSEYKNPFDTLQ